MKCVVYRCARQADLYLYLRPELSLATLPEALRRRTGALTRVMDIELTPERRLARADPDAVREALVREGFYLQLPPRGEVQGHLDDGD